MRAGLSGGQIGRLGALGSEKNHRASKNVLPLHHAKPRQVARALTIQTVLRAGGEF
jgi:hypothetical protein